MRVRKTENWVERRANSERILRDGKGDVWAAVRSALTDACGSYNRHFEPVGLDEVSARLENGKRVRIKIPLLQENSITWREILVEFNENADYIEYVTDSNSRKLILEVVEDKVVIRRPGQGEPMSPDEASRHILEPVLFARKARLRQQAK